MEHEKYYESKENIYIKRIQEKYKELGRSPKPCEITNGISIITFFNGWKNALIKSEIPFSNKRSGNQFSDDQLLNFIREEYNKTKEVPKYKQFAYHNEIKNKFGCWNNALRKAGIKIQKNRKCLYSKEEALEMLIDFTKKYNKVPTKKAIDSCKEIKICSQTLSNIFQMGIKDIVSIYNLKQYVKETELIEIKETLLQECIKRKRLLTKQEILALHKDNILPTIQHIFKLFKTKNLNEIWYVVFM